MGKLEMLQSEDAHFYWKSPPEDPGVLGQQLKCKSWVLTFNDDRNHGMKINWQWSSHKLVNKNTIIEYETTTSWRKMKPMSRKLLNLLTRNSKVYQEGVWDILRSVVPRFQISESRGKVELILLFLLLLSLMLVIQTWHNRLVYGKTGNAAK